MKKIFLALTIGALVMLGTAAVTPLISPAHADAKVSKKMDSCAEIQDAKKKAKCMKREAAKMKKKAGAQKKPMKPKKAQ